MQSYVSVCGSDVEIDKERAMLDSINRFRWQNNRQSVRHTDRLVDEYCKKHCLEMARRHDVFHASECYLDGWSEAVAMMQYCDNWKDKVIFDILGASEGHRDLLLNSDTIACADYVHDWTVYVTVRGKKDS